MCISWSATNNILNELFSGPDICTWSKWVSVKASAADCGDKEIANGVLQGFGRLQRIGQINVCLLKIAHASYCWCLGRTMSAYLYGHNPVLLNCVVLFSHPAAKIDTWEAMEPWYLHRECDIHALPKKPYIKGPSPSKGTVYFCDCFQFYCSQLFLMVFLWSLFDLDTVLSINKSIVLSTSHNTTHARLLVETTLQDARREAFLWCSGNFIHDGYLFNQSSFLTM